MCEQIEQQFARLFFVDSSKINFTPIGNKYSSSKYVGLLSQKRACVMLASVERKKNKIVTSLTDLVDQPKFYIID